MLNCIRPDKKSTRLSSKSSVETLKKNPTLIWYGTCIDCCELNDTPPQQLNKVVCNNCGKKLAIADISNDVSIIEKPMDGIEDAKSTSKCRLCMNVIKTEVFPIWGDKLNYSERILLCCSINVSKYDTLPTDMCKDCVTRLNNAYDFRTFCLKINADFIRSNMLDDKLSITAEEFKIKPEPDFDDNSSNHNFDISDMSCDITDDTANESIELICEKCPMICNNEKEFNIHRDSHYYELKLLSKNVPKIFCQIDGCCDTFIRFRDRERHVISKHQNYTPHNYICPHCAQIMKTLKTFNYHVYFLHSGDEVICNECGKLMNRELLKVHNRKTHMQEIVTCPECGVSLNKYSFKRHMRQVHNEKDKLNCDFCDKKFANKWNLQTHLRTHTGEMPYGCPECGLSFSHRVTMKNHRLHKHNIDMFEKKKDGRKLNRKKTPK